MSGSTSQLDSIRQDIRNNAVFGSIAGITLGLVAYIICYLVMSFCLELWSTGAGSHLVLGNMVAFALPAIAMASVFGLGVGTLATFLVDCFNQTIGYPLSISAQAAHTGGMVAYFSCLPFCFFNQQPTWISFVVGPCIAMLFCQIGAAYFAARSEHRLVLQHARFSKLDPKAIQQDLAKDNNWQFGLSHLIWLTTWCALAFAMHAVLLRFRIDLGSYVLFWLALSAPMSWFVAKWAQTLRFQPESPRTDPPVR